MHSKEDALALVHQAVALCGPHEAHASLLMRHLERTPFADNRLRPHSREQTETLYLTVRVGGREALVSTERLDAEALKELAEEAIRQARLESARALRADLVGPQQYPEVQAFNASTALWTPEQRAEGARVVIEQALSGSLVAEGEYYTATQQLSMANSAGLGVCGARTDAGLKARARSATGAAGYGDGYARDARQINPLEVAEQAVSKALLGGGPMTLGPGSYEVVLEHNAVAELLSHLAPGFGARAIEDGRSFARATGEEITSPLVSITEDPLSADGLYSPFDAEGTCREVVPLVQHGRTEGAVYDSCSGATAGRGSTGHASAPWDDTPTDLVPCSLFMDHGDEDVEALIAAVDLGLLITHFQDLHTVDLSRARLRGVTCEGTFLIKNGVITNRVHDLRFEEDILDAFRGIELISRERKLVVQGLSRCAVVPSLKLSRFNIMGSLS